MSTSDFTRKHRYEQGKYAATRCVPKQLIEDQKASRVTKAKEYLGRFNHDESKILNCIVTGDEMWLHYAEPEQKLSQSSGNELLPTSQEVYVVPSARKVMLVTFDGFTWNNTGSCHAKR